MTDLNPMTPQEEATAVKFRQWLKSQTDRADMVGRFAKMALADEMTEFFGSLIGYWVTWACDSETETAAYRAVSEFDGMSPEEAQAEFPLIIRNWEAGANGSAPN